MSRVIKIILIIPLALLISGLIFVFALLLNNKMDFKILESRLVYDKDITEPFDDIKLTIGSMNIKLLKSDESRINVKVYDRKDSLVSVKVENNALIIDNTNHNQWCFLCFGKNEVIISLPEKEYNLVVNSTSGDIKSQINLNAVTIVATSGDTILNKVNNLVINNTSGDIDVNEVSNVTITSTSGNVKIGKINDSLNIKTTSGDIYIDDLTIMKDSNIKVTSGDITINKSSDNIYHNAKAKSGDVIINNNNRHAEYELKIEAKSGDIKVK